MGCDDAPVYTLQVIAAISIHAPTWGATLLAGLLVWVLCISIHAPTWGATTISVGDQTYSVISIHAPTWGATALSLTIAARLRYFNPRTHMGCDLMLYAWL